MTRIALPFFDGAEADDIIDEATSIDPAERDRLRAAFLTLGKDARLAASPHVYAYYRDVHHMIGGEDWLDEEMGIPQTDAEIWNHVSPRAIMLMRKGDTHYAVIEADCDWEEEHGLCLSFRDGTELVYCGPFDGHPTNSDTVEPGVIYNASDPAFTTRTT